MEPGSGTFVTVPSGGETFGGIGKAVDGGGKAGRIGSWPFGIGMGGCVVGGDGIGDGVTVTGVGKPSGGNPMGGTVPGTGAPTLSLPPTGVVAGAPPPGGGTSPTGDGVPVEKNCGHWAAPVGGLLNEALYGAAGGAVSYVELAVLLTAPRAGGITVSRTSGAGSRSETVDWGTSAMRLPQRARTNDLPSVSNASPVAKRTFFLVQ